METSSNMSLNIPDPHQARPASSILPGILVAAALALGTVGSPVSAAVLYSQLDDPSGNGSPAQIFEPSLAAADSTGADDFTVTGNGWNIKEVRLVTTSGSPQGSANISFYDNDGGLPGNLLQAFLAAPFSGGVAMLGTGIDLAPGIYWLGVSFDRSFSADGQIFWSNRSSQTGFAGVWQNPGGYFERGCPSWTPQTDCLVGGGESPDYLFELSGDRLTSQVPEPATLALMLAALGGIGLSRLRQG